MVLHFVSKILKEVVPLMEHPSESFLAALEEDLVKLTMKHGQLVSVMMNVAVGISSELWRSLFSCILYTDYVHVGRAITL